MATEDFADLALNLLGLADDVTGGALRIGFSLFRMGAASLSGGTGKGGGNRHEEAINRMVMAGDFYGARSYVSGLNLDYSAEREVLRRLDEMESEWNRLREWNGQINGYLMRGDVDGAVDYVDSLDLPYDRRQEIARQIRELARQQEERKRQAERWVRDLSELLKAGKIRKARKYVESLPIDKKVKEAFLAQLPKPGWF